MFGRRQSESDDQLRERRVARNRTLGHRDPRPLLDEGYSENSPESGILQTLIEPAMFLLPIAGICLQRSTGTESF